MIANAQYIEREIPPPVHVEDDIEQVFIHMNYTSLSGHYCSHQVGELHHALASIC